MPFNGFVNSFTNSPIQPSDSSYLNVIFDGISANVTLEWPFQNPAALFPFSSFIQVTGTGTNVYSITLPNALYSSTVQSTIIYNQAAVNVTLYNFNGDVVGICEPDIAYFVGNTDNSTEEGNWVFLTLAAGTSSVTAADLIDPTSNGAGETNAGGLSAYSQYLKINQKIFPYTGTTYVGNASDLGNVVTWTGGSGSYTLANANTVRNGFITGLQNRSTTGGIITIALTGGNTINGSSNVVSLQVNESTYLVSDGSSNWYTFCFSSNIDYVIQNIQYDLATSGGTITVSLLDAANQIQTFSGTYGSPVEVNLPATLTQQYFINNLSTDTSIKVRINGDSPSYTYTLLPLSRITAFSDGTHLYNSPNVIANLDIYLPNGTSSLPALTFVNDPTTGIYRNTGTGALGITQAATSVAEFTSTKVTTTVPVVVPQGTEAAPTLTFSGALDWGLFYDSGTPSLDIVTNGTSALEIEELGITSNVTFDSTAYTQKTISIYSLMRAYG